MAIGTKIDEEANYIVWGIAVVPSGNAGKQEKKEDGISVLKSHPSDADRGTHRWRRGRGYSRRALEFFGAWT